jgi:hypothetical protein
MYAFPLGQTSMDTVRKRLKLKQGTLKKGEGATTLSMMTLSMTTLS